PPYQSPYPSATYTLSLHDALPIFAIRILGGEKKLEIAVRLFALDQVVSQQHRAVAIAQFKRAGILRNSKLSKEQRGDDHETTKRDRKSTRLNSSHDQNSYAVFCLK